MSCTEEKKECLICGATQTLEKHYFQAALTITRTIAGVISAHITGKQVISKDLMKNI